MAAKDEKLRAKVLAVVNESERPVDITYVASKLSLTWPTTRVLLLELVTEKKLYGLRTSSAWVFYSNRKQVEIPV
jgi:CRISPR/Cas system-associated endonuclease Cas3-HD